MAGALRRKADYQLLDDIGYDMVDALLTKQGHTIADFSRTYGCLEFNLTLWLRRQRTLIWLEQATPESIADLIATGYTAAAIAREHNLQVRLVDVWIHANIPAEHLSAARDCAAESMFDKDVKDTETADELGLQRIKLRHSIQRFHAQSTTRRFTDDKTVKVTPGEGLNISFSFTRKKREIGETEDDGVPPPEF